MTTDEKIAMVQAMTEEMDDDVISIFLKIAERKIIEKAYPFHPDEEMPSRYETLQCEICAYLLNKRGAEGQTMHVENGIERTYESASVPSSMLNAVVPMSKAFGESE
jgi:hypothetical protein